MANILIVESKNDKIFIEKVIEILNLKNIEIDPPICINEYDCLEGEDQTKLTTALKSLKANLQKKDIRKVGIILDQDQNTLSTRLNYINQCIEKAFEISNSPILPFSSQLSNISTDLDISLEIGCYFINVEGIGELETLLKCIKTQDSPHADCLNSWRNCLEESGHQISEKEFTKFWLTNYIRFDTCSKKDAKQAGRKCSMQYFDYILRDKADIFDFDNPILDDLKKFLKLFTD